MKTFLNFDYSIHELIDYYDKKPEYKENYGSKAKSLYHYIKINEVNELINHKTISGII